MLTNMSLSKKGLILVAVPITFELVFIVTLVLALANAEHQSWKESHYRAVVAESNNIDRLFYESIALLVAYGFAHSATTGERLDRVEAELRDSLRHLKVLVAGNEHPGGSLETLDRTANRTLSLIGSLREQLDQNLTGVSKESAFGAARSAMNDLLESSQKFLEEQANADRVDPVAQENARNLVRLSIGLGVVLNTAIAFGLAIFFAREISTRLGVIIDNIGRVAAGKELNPPIGGSDEIASLDRSFHDMTEAVAEANRKERAAVEKALDVICSLDSSGRFIKVNPAASKQWGYDDDELIGRNLSEVIVEDDIVATKSAIREIVESGSTLPFENRLRRKEGTIVDLRWSAHWSARDKVVFCIAHDITARKEAERFRQQLMQMVSHDLRTPLASIQHVHEMLLEGVYGELPEAAGDCIRLADTNTNRLMRLVNDLLDFEKMEAGKLVLNFRSLSAASIIKQSVSAVSAFAKEHEVTIAAPARDMAIEADGDRLVQVLINLLSNAIKFSPKNGTVTVTLQDIPGFVQFMVADEGPGIPENLREAIFERFRQIGAGHPGRKIKGTGLGLAICKGIVEGHGGTIGVDSGEAGGSCFWFRIPSQRAQT